MVDDYCPIVDLTGGEQGADPVAPVGGEDTILLVDDELSIETMERTPLKRPGYRVYADADPTAALEKFTADPLAVDW